MRNLSGAVALVTGGGAGIGAAEVKLLGDRGAQVCAVDIDEDAARRSGAALAIGADVADREAMAAVVDRVVEQFGKVDLVFCTAGITHLPTTIRVLKPGEAQHVIDVNLIGTLNTIQPAIEPLIASHGHIIVVSSMGWPPNTEYGTLLPAVGGVAYSTSKVAVEMARPRPANGTLPAWGRSNDHLLRTGRHRDGEADARSSHQGRREVTHQPREGGGRGPEGRRARQGSGDHSLPLEFSQRRSPVRRPHGQPAAAQQEAARPDSHLRLVLTATVPAQHDPRAQVAGRATCQARLAKWRWPSLGMRPMTALSTGASALNGNANAAFGSIATVQLNSVPPSSGSMT